MSDQSIQALFGIALNGFTLVEMTEVFKVDTDGNKQTSLGFFKEKVLAEAFAGVQTDPDYHKTKQEVVLTDGVVGFVVSEKFSVKLVDEEVELREVKKAVLAKISPAEQAVLRLIK